ncbi:MAG TPA: hypothetical protein VGJ41_05805 [Nocardioides sp.]
MTVTELASRVEVAKLAHELSVDEGSLAFLYDRTPDQLRDLRGIVSTALFTRHEDRVKRLASLSKSLPHGITAKIAQIALGPTLSARVAAVMDPADAVRLAKQLDPAFLTDVSEALDPERVQGIVSGLPQDLIVDVGKRLLERGRHLTLGRFVSVVSLDAALGVVAAADADDLLQVAVFTEEPSALEAVVRRLDDTRLAAVIHAAVAKDAYDDAVILLMSLSLDSRRRLVTQLDDVATESRDALVAAIARHDAWADLLPALDMVDDEVLETLVNVPVTCDPDVFERVLAVVRELDLAQLAARMLPTLDDAHRDTLSGSALLRQPDARDWLLAGAGDIRDQVETILHELGIS